MGFGASTLILGNVIAAFFQNENIGWQNTYIIVGLVIAVVLIISGILLKDRIRIWCSRNRKQKRIL